MKFPETKTRSPFYKMLSPLVEKAPMVPFISSFLRLRPGPGLFVQMGCRERAQGPEGQGPAARGVRRWLGRQTWEWGEVSCGPMSGQALFPRRPGRLGGQCLKRTVFQILQASPGPRQGCGLSRPYLTGCSASALLLAVCPPAPSS